MLGNGELDFQVIIPSRPREPKYLTYNSLLPLGKERLIHVLDCPLSRARNRGTHLAKANIVVHTDDDAIIPPEFIQTMVSMVKPGRATIMEGLDPLLLAITRSDYIKVGGFDERIKPYMAEDVEFICRLPRFGIQLITLKKPSNLRHLGGKRKPLSTRDLLAVWNYTLTIVRYKSGYPYESPRAKSLFQYFFLQFIPPYALLRIPVSILAFLWWQVFGRIGRRNSFGW